MTEEKKGRGRPKGFSGKYRHPETNEPISVYEWRKLSGYPQNKNPLSSFVKRLRNFTGLTQIQAEHFVIKATNILFKEIISQKLQFKP